MIFSKTISEILSSIFFFLFLFFLNFILKKNNFIIDSISSSKHKISTIKTPLSGGIFFFFSFIFIDIFYELTNLNYYLFLFIFTFLGFLGDNKSLNSPKVRFFFQLVITIVFAEITNLYLDNSGIIFLDKLLTNNLFNTFFLTLCFMVLLNGTNFSDGLNGFVTTYYILIIISIISLSQLMNSNLTNINHFKLYLSPMLCFLLLNLFNKNFLGDSGTYFLSIFFGLNLIFFINDNYNQVSPFFIVNLLWYPCFEILFTIIRRINFNEKIYLSDKKHLHTLIFNHIQKKGKKNISNPIANSFSSLILIIYLIPMFCFSVLFYNNPVKLLTCLLIYIISYIYIYFRLK
jgi:UDP-N-acetylmuramyl pentapeptide phosphotransferase/UDP-N-acetylglucosamine-1-phosphate transferase